MEELRIWTASELLAHEFPPVRWVVPGLVAEGLTILAGSPKLGKSWLALGIAAAVASGGRALGTIETEARPVLGLFLEDTARRLQNRLGMIGAPATDQLFVTTRWERATKGLAWLNRWLDERETGLIIVDTWQRFAGVQDGNDYSQTSDAAAMLKEVSDERGVPIVAIHHAKKGAGMGDWLDSVLGSAGLAAVADSTLLLRRGRGNRDAELMITGRDVEEQELALNFDSHCGSWSLEGTVQERQATSARQEIYDYLEDSGSATPKQIADDLKRNASTTRTLLRKMADDGVLLCLSGHYAVAGKTVDSVDAWTQSKARASTESTRERESTASIESTHSPREEAQLGIF